MILGALDEAGGQTYLLEQARQNPTAFLTLLGKILPTELKADVTHTGLVDVLSRIGSGNDNPPVA